MELQASAAISGDSEKQPAQVWRRKDLLGLRGMSAQEMNFVLDTANAFKQVALIEYPRPGTWSLVFIAADARGAIGDHVAGDSESDEPVSVFLPTSPNPTNGFLLFVKKSELVLLDLTIEDAAKMIISAGLLSPEQLADRHAKEQNTRAARRLKRFATPPAA